MNTHKKTNILLFGMPRSGTTWIGKIFDSHESVYYRHEPDTWKSLPDIPLNVDVGRWAEYCPRLEHYLDEIAGFRHPNVDCKLPQFSKAYLTHTEQALFQYTTYISKLLSRAGLPNAYFKPSYKDKDYILAWKSIQYLGQMGVCLRCIPGSTGVHIIRHPCGYVSSVLEGEKAGRFTSSTPEAEDFNLFDMLLETNAASGYHLDIGRIKQMSPIERLAWRWLLFNEKCLLDTEGQDIFRLIYEDLCASPMEKAKEVFEFCGLGWSTQTERFLMQSTTTSRNAYYSVYKNPAESAEKWRQRMSADDIALVKKVFRQSRIQEVKEYDF